MPGCKGPGSGKFVICRHHQINKCNQSSSPCRWSMTITGIFFFFFFRPLLRLPNQDPLALFHASQQSPGGDQKCQIDKRGIRGEFSSKDDILHLSLVFPSPTVGAVSVAMGKPDIGIPLPCRIRSHRLMPASRSHAYWPGRPDHSASPPRAELPLRSGCGCLSFRIQLPDSASRCQQRPGIVAVAKRRYPFSSR